MDVNSNKTYGSGCCICLAPSALREVLIDNDNIKLEFFSFFVKLVDFFRAGHGITDLS